MQLVLADGHAFPGEACGAARDVPGEVVFNTIERLRVAANSKRPSIRRRDIRVVGGETS